MVKLKFSIEIVFWSANNGSHIREDPGQALGGLGRSEELRRTSGGPEELWESAGKRYIKKSRSSAPAAVMLSSSCKELIN